MLLKDLCDFSKSRRILEDLAFAPKSIRWVLPLDGEGRLLSSGPVETEGERNRGKILSAPRTSLDKGVGGIAEFLADGLTAVFGLDAEPDKPLNTKQRQDRNSNNRKKWEHFWSQIREANEATGHPGLVAILNFREVVKDQPSFFRWGKTNPDDPKEKPKWWLKTATGTELRLGPDQFTFQVNGDLLILDEKILRPYWRGIYAKELDAREAQAPLGLCLVTGVQGARIATTHLPKIQGVPGTQSFGAAIVSFDKPAFGSYGFTQSGNAPISLQAVAAYCHGLNHLLSLNDHSIFLGQTVLCFWAPESREVGSFFAQMLNKPDPSAVADFLKAPWAGIDRTLAKANKFCSVTLSGNAGRIVVRHWMQQTVEQTRENFVRWFRDLNIAEMPKPNQANPPKRRKEKDQAGGQILGKDSIPPLAVFRLACATVREAKDLQSEVSAQLYRAALENSKPSLLLLKPLLHRFTVDLQKYGLKTLLNVSRFALLKLILNRNRKEGEPMLEPEYFETDDPAYNCGGLLAVLAEAQAKAHEFKLEGAGVAERYFGSASVSPSSVFPLLLRLNRHHLNKIKKSAHYGGHERFLEEDIQAVLIRLRPVGVNQPPNFPRTLDLQAQGRFALGFYQKKARMETDRASARKERDAQKAAPATAL